ncbi:hypothetical protein [Nocardioides sp.]|uniref:hypothetical protein n=1 Tax=Nocardioides sp. TaxID=35761 RepID=UPI0025EC2E9F|nr:hypothetical protein [Nocardioides sp.]
MTEQMTEQQIKDGYARLGEALAPPTDVAERVHRRVGVRRRRRRAGVVAGTLAAVVAAGGGVVAATSGDDGPGDTVAVDQPHGPVSTLAMTRPDGSTYGFSDVTVSCDPPRTVDGQRAGDPAPGRIWAYSPIEPNGSVESDDTTITHPFVYVEGRVTQLQDAPTFTFPLEPSQASDQLPILLFVADTEGAEDGNEVSTDAGRPAGTVRVLEASCDPVPVLRLEVDATLGSEEGKQSLDLAGALD